MSNIERNFVQDNGTVKENISYNQKYVNSDNTDNYRRIGDIPVSGNYELNLPYPLDARTLVPKVEYLTDTNWWRTAFGIDTVLYKGMLVTCIDSHKTYVYDGATIKLTAGTTILASDWKKQRIDKSLVKWPIDENENEIIRIGADITSPYKNIEGLYITNNSNLKGPSFYITDNFISLGANLSVIEEDEQIYPFIPYNLISGDTNFKDTYADKQTGIFIPTSSDDTEVPMSIYSARGINIRGSLIGDGLINQIELDTDGNLTNFAVTDINLNASNNLKANVGTSLVLNVSTNLDANIDNNININAKAETAKFSGNRYLETSANLVNSSTFTLNTLTDVSINAIGQVYVKYAAGVKIFGNADDKSVLNMTPNYVELKTPNNVSIYSADSNIILSAKNGKVRIDSSALDLSAKNLANIKAKEFLVDAGKFGFNYDTNAVKYTKIDGSTGFLTLAAKGTNGESKIVLETGEPGSAGRIINITSNLINLNSEGTTNIDTTNFYVKSNDNTLISVEDGRVDIGLKNTEIYLNKMPFPAADDDSEGVLRLTKNRHLHWSKDIGVHHANEKNSDERDITNSWIRLATIVWEKDTEGTPKTQSETLIMSISDNQNAEIFMIKVNCNGGTYTANVQRLSYFTDMTQYHEISVVKRTTGEYIDIYVKAFSNQFAWNGLAYSSNCTITETLDVTYDKETSQPATITTVNYKETLFNPNNATSTLTKNSLIIPWPNDNSIERNKSAFLRYTRAANGVGGNIDWGYLDNQLKDIANNDAGTKVYIIGTERTGAATSTCNEFYNNVRVYIDQYCNIFATAFYATSDERKKKDIKEIEFNDASILIPKEYRFKDSNKKAYGFIAQEVEKAGYTDIVNTDKDTGDKTLDYNSAFAIAIAQMQAKIKQLEDEIKELKNK